MRRSAGAPSDAEFAEIAEIALAGPGPVLLRAVGRVFGESEDRAVRFEELSRIVVDALAPYLDAPEFHLLFATKAGWRARRVALRRGVWEGNLEAVLEEQLACEQGLGATEPTDARESSALAALREGACTPRQLAACRAARRGIRPSHAAPLSRCHRLRAARARREGRRGAAP